MLFPCYNSIDFNTRGGYEREAALRLLFFMFKNIDGKVGE
jgi:hypothetical protein